MRNIFATLILFIGFQAFGLSVTFNKNTVNCGQLTTILGTFDCNFNGSVILTATSLTGVTFPVAQPYIRQVSSGVLNFTIKVGNLASNPVSIKITVISNTNNLGCAPINTIIFKDLFQNCPPNDECATAAILPVIVGAPVFQNFDATYATESPLNYTCDHPGYEDLWYQFTAVNTTQTIHLAGIPGTVGFLSIYNGCGGNHIICRLIWSGQAGWNTQVVPGLVVGTNYKIRFEKMPTPVGNQSIAITATSNLIDGGPISSASASNPSNLETDEAAETRGNKFQEMVAYPNPTQGDLNLIIPNVYNENSIVVEVFSLFGKSVYKMDYETENVEIVNTNIDLSALPKANYILRISSQKTLKHQNIAIQ